MMGSGANPAYFQAGKDFANSPSGIAAVKGAITGANAADKVPGYATTHEHSSLYADGNGNLVGPGASKVSGCAGFTSTDKAKQYECDAVNLVAGNPPRPKFTIMADDPILAKGKAVKNELAAMGDAFGEKYSACQTKTVTEPDVYSTEICADILGNDPESCIYGRKIVIDADSNFQCDKTINAYETHKCRRWVEPNIAEKCDASTPYTTQVVNTTASWWWCGSSCEPRADVFISTLVNFAVNQAGLSLKAIYGWRYECADPDIGPCYWTQNKVPSASPCYYNGYSMFSAEFEGPRNIKLYMDGVYRGESKHIGYNCDALQICYDNNGAASCFGKSSRKPMIEFHASINNIIECQNKVWICHHKGRFPCHWACKDSGVLCDTGTLETNPDGSQSCISNCRNVLDGVTMFNECAPFEARSIP